LAAHAPHSAAQDFVRTLLPPTTLLLAFPDAGYFLDQPTFANGSAFVYRDEFIGADPMWQATAAGTPPAACLAAYAPADRWHCLMAQYVGPHASASVPFFVMNSAYDMWAIGNIMQVGAGWRGVEGGVWAVGVGLLACAHSPPPTRCPATARADQL
jgi:hypothetical protein